MDKLQFVVLIFINILPFLTEQGIHSVVGKYCIYCSQDFFHSYSRLYIFAIMYRKII